jgi:FtsP/CotA-like multicopper oxidase with cupredoxin domain
LQRAGGLYGALIVHEAPAEKIELPKYDEDIALMVGDWYHRSAGQILDYYTDWTNFGNEVRNPPAQPAINADSH